MAGPETTVKISVEILTVQCAKLAVCLESQH